MGAEARGFEVTAAALTGHARSVDRIAGEIGTAHDAGAHVRMGAEAYGQIPVCQAIPFLLDFLQGPAVDALAAAREALHSAAGALDTTVIAYHDTDGTVSALLQRLHR
ncbi:ESX-1 secretion-associated protein [Micromonospora sp. WMMA2032]|uniref:ESX-1 secretion-associated protein n=1 Tax=Micromonospora sp. WMMA2032 TaxID=2039870 RepID=UPI000C058802|nr:ESX-1 secretion-associated protein [Micromonospora sp. WMMA2032]ATO15224.1 ESX-1 secretion-associated protein [Micromonospora sp. WMMA2032]